VNNIALIGFMGTGKTAVGLSLAESLGWDFVDTDKMIEEKTGIAITEIFHKYGEQYFRREESEIVQTVSWLKQSVIATGGGVVLNEDNISCIKKWALIICLRANPEDILDRVRCDDSRPLLAVDDPLKIINNLLKKREPYYQCADIYIDTSEKNVENIVAEILSQLEKRGMTNAASSKYKG